MASEEAERAWGYRTFLLPHLQHAAVEYRVDRHWCVDPLRAQCAVANEGHVVLQAPLNDMVVDGKRVRPALHNCRRDLCQRQKLLQLRQSEVADSCWGRQQSRAGSSSTRMNNCGAVLPCLGLPTKAESHSASQLHTSSQGRNRPTCKHFSALGLHFNTTEHQHSHIRLDLTPHITLATCAGNTYITSQTLQPQPHPCS